MFGLATSGPNGWAAFLAEVSQSFVKAQGSHVASTMRYIYWLLEALMIISVAVLVGSMQPVYAYNEFTGKWAQIEKELEVDVNVNAEQADTLTVFDLSNLCQSMPETNQNREKWYTLKLRFDRDEVDPNFRVISIDHIENTRNTKGKVSTQKTEIVRLGLIGHAVYDNLLQAIESHTLVAYADIDFGLYHPMDN